MSATSLIYSLARRTSRAVAIGSFVASAILATGAGSPAAAQTYYDADPVNGPQGTAWFQAHGSGKVFGTTYNWNYDLRWTTVAGRRRAYR
jgi:hypothetical protein